MNSVLKATGYVLVHTPDMVLHHGTTQTTERRVNPTSDYLQQLPKHLRSFEEVVAYPPNQTYIGNITPQDLAKIEAPWVDKKIEGATRDGKFGEIMPQDEFIGLMQVCDVFDLIKLEKNFAAKCKETFLAHPLLKDLADKIKEGEELETIMSFINDEHSESFIHEGKVVGCVKRAHDIDENLSAHIMFENLVSKASAVLSLLNLTAKNDVNKEDIDYVIDCCEEACGDMNQRGGGNFAKACAEVAGFVNATGSDVRGFCAGPAHALIHAASLVASGTFKNVVVSAGGCTAKLGMNGKDHIKKGLPILEDCLGGFAILVSENDGISPEIITTVLGKHVCGTGSSPQAVITALVTDALDRAELKITDVDKYSAEMQNPDITKPAGAGDVPAANYKMIAALAVKRGELQRAEVATFGAKHGMPGWAPTQGHIPSGVPYLGFCRDEILAGTTKRAMIIGKGSLFLGRMTNLFDGVSFLIETNKGNTPEQTVSEEQIKGLIANALKNFASNLLAE
ncbi:glycine reductase [Sedimentibacter sp. zth1]|uniref:glycine/sarcosine/betaine reductase complex component C subunit beta n=1 Tax=Sedimentibacter sp. zth1 TaxID=2816908 RepID=UPI001A92E78C|nr:glycine/sarcosine/betaine reductase complex component C subunit beta [Sedimentibacter sp. zth1]QSX06226.1 glycine reductase [Sedimentibacter sp. zth1]